MIRSATARLLLILIATALTTSCTENATPPENASERIQGFVSDDSGPLESIRVVIERIDLPDDHEFLQETRTDSNGWFDIPVLPGFYLLHADDAYYDGDGLRLGRRKATPIVVQDDVPTTPLQLRFASFQVELDSPGEAFAGEMRIWLDPVDPEVERRFSGSGRFQDDRWVITAQRVPPGRYGPYLSLNSEQLELPDPDTKQAISEVTLTGGKRLTISTRLREPTMVVVPTDSRSARLSKTIYGEVYLDDSTDYLRAHAEVDSFSVATLVTYTCQPFGVRFRLRSRNVTGYGYSPWFQSYSYEGAQIFEPKHGGTIELPTFEESGFTLKLSFPRGSQAVQGDLSLRSAAGPTLLQGRVIEHPDSLLTVRWFGILPGLHALHFNSTVAGTVVDQWYTTDGTIDSPDMIEIAGTEEEQIIEWTLSPGAILRGHARYSDGEPVTDASASVYMSRATSPADWVMGGLSPEGAFEATGVENGSWKVGVRTPDEGLWWYPGTGVWKEAEVVTVSNYEEIDGIEIVILR